MSFSSIDDIRVMIGTIISMASNSMADNDYKVYKIIAHELYEKSDGVARNVINSNKL